MRFQIQLEVVKRGFSWWKVLRRGPGQGQAHSSKHHWRWRRLAPYSHCPGRGCCGRGHWEIQRTRGSSKSKHLFWQESGSFFSLSLHQDCGELYQENQNWKWITFKQSNQIKHITIYFTFLLCVFQCVGWGICKDRGCQRLSQHLQREEGTGWLALILTVTSTRPYCQKYVLLCE